MVVECRVLVEEPAFGDFDRSVPIVDEAGMLPSIEPLVVEPADDGMPDPLWVSG